MSTRPTGRSETTQSTFSILPAQQNKVVSDELDALVDSFIDLIIDDFIERYHSGQLDITALKKKGKLMIKK